jgi:inosose dehydratase
MKSRRQFLKVAGTGILAAGVSNAYASVSRENIVTIPEIPFTLGMAGYTFREFTVEQTIEMMKRAGVNTLSLKDFHLPYNSTKEKIDEVLKKFSDAGITVYTLGVIYMNTREFVDQAFNYAKLAGMKMIVAAPNYELLDYVEEKVKANDIRIAIHNHGPDNTLYPNATDIWNNIKDRDSRLGICIDIGHTIRDGEDPAVDIQRYSERIYDMHIKDVTSANKEGKTVEMGRGIIDIPNVIAAIMKINYSGKCSLEFEKDMKDPLAGIAESIGYWRGVVACLKS